MENLKIVGIMAAVALVVTLVVAPLLSKTTIVKEMVNSVGSVSSPDIISPYVSVGGEREWRQRTDTLNVASTTVCALQGPASTSTLQFGSLQLRVSSTTASTITIAKAATRFATTTIIGDLVPVAAGAQATIVASTTATQLIGQTHVFAPSDWLVISMAGGIGHFSPTGSCAASWLEN